MKLSGFERVIFFPVRRPATYVVYVFFPLNGDDDHEATPFYVGRTGRIEGRMADYTVATFTAVTDFKVGEAVQHLMSKGVRI
jgi:hypothetical protein